MKETSLLVIGFNEVADALAGLETETIDAVRNAYLAHRAGKTSLPHSVFLHFGEKNPNRIIGLPAYLANQAPIAGLKWIASFPMNTDRGIDRASAVLVLNSLETGHPVALLESSIISSRRTAASAALAARTLHSQSPSAVSLIGCGLINFEVLRFIRHVFPSLRDVVLCDVDPQATKRFAARIYEDFADLKCSTVSTSEEAFRSANLISIATIAPTPHIESSAGLSADSTVLHLSLRDLAPQVIRKTDNIVDDVDHVLRERTSLHLTELEDGNRKSVRGTLADVLCGEMPPRIEGRPCVFSPFGLGILDLALARLVLRKSDAGTEIKHFLPDSRSD